MASPRLGNNAALCFDKSQSDSWAKSDSERAMRTQIVTIRTVQSEGQLIVFIE